MQVPFALLVPTLSSMSNGNEVVKTELGRCYSADAVGVCYIVVSDDATSEDDLSGRYSSSDSLSHWNQHRWSM